MRGDEAVCLLPAGHVVGSPSTPSDRKTTGSSNPPSHIMTCALRASSASAMTSGQVCARCSQIKQRCDGGSPCARCARLGHICEPRGADTRLGASAVAYRRPRASRSRSGCLPCKNRKKKCDEARPRCSDCRRLNIPCRWPSSQSESPGETTGSTASDASPAVQLETFDEQLFEKAFDGAQDSPVTSTGDPILLPDITDEPAPLPISMPCTNTNPHLRSKEDNSLFNHYLHVVARALSRSSDQDGNPFLSTLLPIAATSDTVTSVILGLSGCHWRRVYPAIWNCALARQGRALAQVNSLLGHPDPQSTLEACVAVLLLCLTELFDGSSRVWKWHLKAAGAILQSPAMEPIASTAEWSFCSSLFHYLDAVSTISRCKPPLLHEGESRLTDLTRFGSTASKVPRADSEHAVAIYGISPTLFDLLGMVNLLAKHRSRRTDELAEIGFRAAAAHLEVQIDEWRVEHDLLLGQQAGDRATEQTTTAFEWAVRLRLHQIVDGYDPQHETVQRAVSAILDAALQVPYGSRVEGCLLFPLVIAGASSTGIEGQMMVKERLMVMENTLGFGHIQYARQLLETVWDGEQAAEPNWAYVRYTSFPGVVFI
ncbi:hypothetical protein PHISP_04025 [Aspergillus sp. HF37]|nr:hypothetical protein PHISP_04025 [Aspergillus sp. HF37]